MNNGPLLYMGVIAMKMKKNYFPQLDNQETKKVGFQESIYFHSINSIWSTVKQKPQLRTHNT